MPDIDVDFCFERRGEVIEYVRERYGRNSVGQIVTFGTMKARAAVEDGARGLGGAGGGRGRGTAVAPGRGRRAHQADPFGTGLQSEHSRGGKEDRRAPRAGA